MKGICHIWSRGRHFSPSLPGDRYLNLGSKSDLRAEISGSIVWYDALAPRPEVLFSFSASYANDLFWVLFKFLRRRKFPKTNLFHSSERLKNFPFFSKRIVYLSLLRFSFLCINEMVLEFFN